MSSRIASLVHAPKHWILDLAALALLFGGLGQPWALATPVALIDPATVLIDRYVDLTDIVEFQELLDGVVIFQATQGGESYSTTLPLGAPTTSTVDFRANIFEPGPIDTLGPLSDTFMVTAPAGSVTIFESFISDSEGGAALTPLTGSNVQTIIENGGFQSIGTTTLADGSTLGFQFQSDLNASVPEPATLVLVGLGLAGLGFSRRSKLT